MRPTPVPRGSGQAGGGRESSVITCVRGGTIQPRRPATEPIGRCERQVGNSSVHGEGVHHLPSVVGSVDQYFEPLRATGEAAPAASEASVAGLTRFVYLDGLAHRSDAELIEMIGEDA